MHDLEQLLRDRTIEFPLGLPGFRDDHRFVLTQTESERPFAWLNSLDTPGLAFVVVEPRYVFPGYTAEVDDAALAPLGPITPGEVAVLVILRVDPGPPQVLRANLRAPIVVHLPTRRAVQVILGDESGQPDDAPLPA